MHNLGKNLKHLRKALGKTQAECAALFNKGATTIGNWENGESEPSVSELVILSKYFGISTDDILFGDLELKQPGGTLPIANEGIWEAINALRKEFNELKKKVQS